MYSYEICIDESPRSDISFSSRLEYGKLYSKYVFSKTVSGKMGTYVSSPKVPPVNIISQCLSFLTVSALPSILTGIFFEGHTRSPDISSIRSSLLLIAVNREVSGSNQPSPSLSDNGVPSSSTKVESVSLVTDRQ